MTKRLLHSVVILIVILFVNGCGDNNINKEKIASNYLASNYPEVEFKYQYTNYKIDGGIYQITYKTGSPEFEISVFVKNDIVYDNYLRTYIENNEKEKLFSVIDNYIKENQLEVHLDSSFEDDNKLKERIERNEKFRFYISIYHIGDRSRSSVEEIYSKIANKIYGEFDNIDSIVVKDYNQEDKELYFSIDKTNLKNDYSIENIKNEIRNQKIFYILDGQESKNIDISKLVKNIDIPYSPIEYL